MMLMNRVPLSTWFHLLEAKIPSGEARVIATLCTRVSIEKLKESLENKQKGTHQNGERLVYTITTAPIYQPNRRCDTCKCPK
jgi:uncharacterized protein with von Willebrand factor type A (vWA) domain